MRDYKDYFSGKKPREQMAISSSEKRQPSEKRRSFFGTVVQRAFSLRRLYIGLAIVGGIVFFVSGVLAWQGWRRLQVPREVVSHIGRLFIQQQMRDHMDPRGMGGIEPVISNATRDLRFYFYEVQRGDSLSSIARKLGTSMDSLISLNGLDNAHFLKPGNRILVPDMDGVLYVVRKNDTLERIAQKYRISVDDIMDHNDLEEEALGVGHVLFLPGASLTAEERARALGYLFAKPVRGRFTSGFGIRIDPFTRRRGFHAGIDVAARYGTPIRAAQSGRVTLAGWHGGYGITVMIRHQMGYETLYAHLSRATVRVGQYVNKGEVIGRMGSTGRSTGTHLHFEVHRHGRPINPVRLQGLGRSSRRWF